MENSLDLQIERLQQNLAPIRRIAGWTGEDLGNLIGLTKQTISNLENGKVKMSQTQYIAIRAMLDGEMKKSKENDLLPQVVSLLLDSDGIPDDEYEKLKESVAAASLSASNLSTAKMVFGATVAAIPVIGKMAMLPFLGATAGVILSHELWHLKIHSEALKKSKKRKGANYDSDNL